MCWDESLSLGGDGSKDTILIESHAVGATTVVGIFETGAANLQENGYKRNTFFFFVRRVYFTVPFSSCNNGKRLRYAGEVRAAGDRACNFEGEEVVVGGQRSDLVEEVVVAGHVGDVAALVDSTHEDLGGDRFGEGGERPYRDENLEQRDEERDE